MLIGRDSGVHDMTSLHPGGGERGMLGKYGECDTMWNMGLWLQGWNIGHISGQIDIKRDKSGILSEKFNRIICTYYLIFKKWHIICSFFCCFFCFFARLVVICYKVVSLCLCLLNIIGVTFPRAIQTDIQSMSLPRQVYLLPNHSISTRYYCYDERISINSHVYILPDSFTLLCTKYCKHSLVICKLVLRT